MATKKGTTITHTVRLQGFEPKPLFEETNLPRIIESQKYKGYKPGKVKKLVEQLEVEESLEDLLAALK